MAEYVNQTERFHEEARAIGHGHGWQGIGPIHYICDCGHQSRQHSDWAEHVGLVRAQAAALEVVASHRDYLTGHGTHPHRLEECVCLGCQIIRALDRLVRHRG